MCVGNLAIIGSDNGLSPYRRQAIIWTSAGILLIGPSGTNFSEILIEIHTFSSKKMLLKMSSGKWRPFCLGLNVLTVCLWLSEEIFTETHKLMFIIRKTPTSGSWVPYLYIGTIRIRAVMLLSCLFSFVTFEKAVIPFDRTCLSAIKIIGPYGMWKICLWCIVPMLLTQPTAV